tara:strand:+ start:224 stop:505 length:282 start_codon:yes stop_codon:yes gene_type:complete
MALTIKEHHGLFSVAGSINATTAKHFQTHFENILNVSGDLTIDIENINEIDEDGINAIRVLYNNAITFDRGFLIIGNVSQNIYESIRSIKVAA